MARRAGAPGPCSGCRQRSEVPAVTITARAARLVAHGEALRVEQVELADPGEGEALVELAYAGVNPVDRYQVLGRVAAELPLPRTPGSEASGIVRTGTAERPVLANRGALAGAGDGLFATHAVVRADRLVEVPEGVGLDLAAAMGVAGTTAWRCVTELAEVAADDRVLVLGASGGVGSIVVSACHRIGAEIVGHCGAAAKVPFVAARGADRVMTGDAAALRDGLAGFRPTAVFDPLGGPFTGVAVEAMAERGRLVLFGTSAEPTGVLPLQLLYRKGLRVLGYGGLIEPPEALARGMRDSLAALRDGRLEVVVDDVLGLDEVNEALDRLARREVEGKLLLDLRH